MRFAELGILPLYGLVRPPMHFVIRINNFCLIGTHISLFVGTISLGAVMSAMIYLSFRSHDRGASNLMPSGDVNSDETSDSLNLQYSLVFCVSLATIYVSLFIMRIIHQNKPAKSLSLKVSRYIRTAVLFIMGILALIMGLLIKRSSWTAMYWFGFAAISTTSYCLFEELGILFINKSSP
jgi:hypothetical protein